MKTNLIFLGVLVLGIAIIIINFRHLTQSEIHHCMVTSTDKSICK